MDDNLEVTTLASVLPEVDNIPLAVFKDVQNPIYQTLPWLRYSNNETVISFLKHQVSPTFWSNPSSLSVFVEVYDRLLTRIARSFNTIGEPTKSIFIEAIISDGTQEQKLSMWQDDPITDWLEQGIRAFIKLVDIDKQTHMDVLLLFLARPSFITELLPWHEKGVNRMVHSLGRFLEVISTRMKSLRILRLIRTQILGGFADEENASKAFEKFRVALFEELKRCANFDYKEYDTSLPSLWKMFNFLGETKRNEIRNLASNRSSLVGGFTQSFLELLTRGEIKRIYRQYQTNPSFSMKVDTIIINLVKDYDGGEDEALQLIATIKEYMN